MKMKWLMAIMSVLITLFGLFIADEAARHKFGAYAGLNRHGYRGAIVGPKEPGEVRIVVLGGSVAFGYGVRERESFPRYLEKQLRLSRISARVINLAYNSESAVCFKSTLEQYRYLKPDIVIIMSGINDTVQASLYRREKDCFRNKSLIFRWTGYMPILPLVMKEKYYLMRYGSVEEGYRETYRRASLMRGVNQGYEVPADGERSAMHRYGWRIKLSTTYGRVRVVLVSPPLFEENKFARKQQRYLFETVKDYEHPFTYKYRFADLTNLFDGEDADLFTHDGNNVNRPHLHSLRNIQLRRPTPPL